MDTRQQKNKKVSSDEWYTPKWIIDALGEFDLDPCSPIDRPFDTAKVHYSKNDDGLSKVWTGRVWLNPPYSRVLLRQFVERLAALFFFSDSMLFMRHRVKFICPDGRKSEPFFGSCLVAWGKHNDDVLRQCGIEGKYVKLNEK